MVRFTEPTFHVPLPGPQALTTRHKPHIALYRGHWRVYYREPMFGTRRTADEVPWRERGVSLEDQKKARAFVERLNLERKEQTMNPLSNHALAELEDIAEGPVPSSTINPGVSNKLLTMNLVEQVNLRSPFPVHKGGTCPHLRITDAGRNLIGKLKS